MGTTPSNAVPDTWDSSLVLTKLQAVPYNNKVASIKEIKNSDEWKEWIRQSEPHLVVDLLLGREYFANKPMKTYHIACAFLGLLEIFNPNSELVRKKRKKELQAMDPTIVQANFYLILNKYLTSPKLLRSSLGTTNVNCSLTFQ